MSISTYSELKAEIASWLNRSDLSETIPTLIQLAEVQLNADLTSRFMEVKASLPVTAGVSTASLPSDLLDIKRLQVVGSPNRVLIYRSPDEIAQDNAANQTGMPETFSVFGNTLELAPIPDSDCTLELLYYQKIPALSDSNPTNWLLTNWPNAYLFGALLQAQPFLMNDERIPVFQSLYSQAVEGLNVVDWYSGSTMRVRAR
ncbi:hypothetical protein [Pseudomonas sp.]|uniref:phage adaptor protein n=1 Tax=Pseudomonas sp. TaxID=306 RepID=UPI00258F3735|nr:hypothetical protein [Pseudomonas sp.]